MLTAVFNMECVQRCLFEIGVVGKASTTVESQRVLTGTGCAGTSQQQR